MDTNTDTNINTSNLFSIKDKKTLIEEIYKLNKVEYIEIFKIFSEDNIKYTENANGIFINISKTPDETLHKIKYFLDFYKKNNVRLNNDKLTRSQLAQDYFASK